MQQREVELESLLAAAMRLIQVADDYLDAQGDLNVVRELVQRCRDQCDTALSLLPKHKAMSCAACERAYQMLETIGVPRSRAGSVANGIEVISTRHRKEAHAQQVELTKLREFFATVARLTVNHRACGLDTAQEHAWVSPADLGAALEKVDRNWSQRAHQA